MAMDLVYSGSVREWGDARGTASKGAPTLPHPETASS